MDLRNAPVSGGPPEELRLRNARGEWRGKLPARRGTFRSLQRTMGDVRDAEMLMSELAGEKKRNPAALSETAAILQAFQERQDRRTLRKVEGRP